MIRTTSEILDEYKGADLTKRMHLYLQYRDLRNEFHKMDQNGLTSKEPEKKRASKKFPNFLTCTFGKACSFPGKAWSVWAHRNLRYRLYCWLFCNTFYFHLNIGAPVKPPGSSGGKFHTVNRLRDNIRLSFRTQTQIAIWKVNHLFRRGLICGADVSMISTKP